MNILTGKLHLSDMNDETGIKTMPFTIIDGLQYDATGKVYVSCTDPETHGSFLVDPDNCDDLGQAIIRKCEEVRKRFKEAQNVIP